MTRDKDQDKRDYLPPVYHGDQTPHPEDLRGPAPIEQGLSARENRGTLAPSQGSGAVVGSGAAAGGSGASEDYDADPQGGGGRVAPKKNAPA
ncbi:hypothetical protein [Flavisphingomonas formosensis]|uniref:hypothetical protein n=1 Tax=Flavisphingomonas formosensis TaxID=861534 RepID=UPI0012FBBB59|nr:hypothetical protein [Sphingomonas formosensis]